MGEPEDRIVLRREPCAAAVDHGAIRKLVGPDPAADAVACLENDNGLPRLAEPSRRSEPCVPRADDTNVGIDSVPHFRKVTPTRRVGSGP